MGKFNRNVLLLFIIFNALFSACGEQEAAREDIPASDGTYQVAPLFREFYDHLGGYETMGPAISSLMVEGHLKMQYIDAALMVYDVSAVSSDRYYLAPLGELFGISDPTVLDPGSYTDLYVDGHIIPEQFTELYLRLGGAQFVGSPLTEIRFNSEKNRIEQYFQNLGFYYLLEGESGQIGLLSYGAYNCDFTCRYQPPSNSIPSINATILPRHFAEMVLRLGPAFTGQALTDAYYSPQGIQEVVFENLVMYADAKPPFTARAKPIVEAIYMPSQALVERISDPRMIFYVMDGNRGHNIPVVFSEYMAKHGGVDLFGFPISELFEVEAGLYRQCFRNLCLDYFVDAPSNQQVRPTPLGHVYIEVVYKPVYLGSFPESQSMQNIRIEVWEAPHVITSEQVAQIHVSISSEGSPLKNREPVLTLSLPDGSQDVYQMDRTDANGQTSIYLGPIEALNGTYILYEVCIENLNAEKACVQSAFTVWGNP